MYIDIYIAICVVISPVMDWKPTAGRTQQETLVVAERGCYNPIYSTREKTMKCLKANRASP